ncbi:MAG: UvrD-helicase domain-containing protein [Clostridiales bacterium]|nr:UvrD-helicase domain-containing protein [Clostridiales bacterium]
MKFSAEQEKIINAELNNNLVSASAGSGKTTVLTARIGEEVKSGRLSVDGMLVVTFTEDAASHMADKIEEKLRSLRNEAVLARDNELAERLSAQIDLLPNAYIQTMHGFCSRVIKEKGYVLEDGPMADFTDPSCRILSDSEQGVLLQHAVEYAIKAMYEECTSEDDNFVSFTRRFGDGRSDMSLAGIVTGTYKTLRSLPDYLDKCEELISKREERDRKGQVMYFETENDIPETIAGYLNRIKTIILSSDFDSVLASHETYQIVDDMSNEEYISEVISGIDHALEHYETHKGADFFKGLAKLKELGELKYKNIFRNPDFRGDDKAFLAIISLRHFISPGSWAGVNYDNALDLPEEYSDLIGFDEEQILENQKEGTKACRAFVELLKKTDDYYMRVKNTMHGMDYSDLEHTAHAILKNPEAADFYRVKFEEIFVDEYQDNTRLQDAIIACFNRETGNVFRVGDIKQSIYKFRFADPNIFSSRMDDIRNGREKGNLHFLKENHRSTCEILSFANYVFRQIMSKDASEIEYDDTQCLSKAGETRHGDIPRIIVTDKSVPINDDGDKTKPEVRAVLAAVESEVRRYLEECTRVDGSRTEFKDICVLTASNNQAETIARYLNGCTLKDGRKIEASGRFTTDVFEDLDIHRLINFLICLGNEYRDEYLAGVMLSNYRFSNFTIGELAQIQAFIHELDGVSLEKEPLMLRLRIFIEKCDDELAVRVRRFVDVFDKIRMSSMVSDIDDIIELVYRETGIKATLEARDGDSNKFDVFKDWLSESFKMRGSDLSGIADELEQMKIQIKGADIEVTDANKNKITTMTVHKSKGLEFPFVILVATGGQDEKKDTLSSIMFDRDDGFITEDYDPDLVIRNHSFEQYIYKMKMRLQTNAETCRLLYVALTRAEENLSIITGCHIDDKSKSSPMRKAFSQAIDYEDVQFDKRHWLAGDMKLPYCLFSALARSRDGEKLREITETGDLKQSNIVIFKDLDGNETRGFDVFELSSDKIAELYEEQKSRASQKETEKKEETKDKERPDFDPDGKLVLPEYKYNESTDIPFKLSVTGITGDRKPSDTVHVDLQIKSIDDFESPNVSLLTSAAKGTILHRIMRFIDLEGIRTGRVAFEEEINDLIGSGYLNICSPDDALKVASEFKNGIIVFCKDDRCSSVIESFNEGTARSEKPIVYAVYTHGKEGDSVLVQGIIDLIYKTPEGFTILDYKTDRLEGLNAEERAKEALERHSFQLENYAAACGEDGIKVSHKLIYLVRYGEFVEV